MRSLEKKTVPDVLQAKGEEWTREYLAALQDGKEPTARWGHVEIRSVLADETSKKCAYCEGFIPDISYPNVEHIIPKSADPELVYVWDNLTSACVRCNTAKGAFHDPDCPLLNPYVDDPDDHLHFLGGWVVPRDASSRGELTIRKLQLSRLDLCNSRQARLEKIHEMYMRWRASEPPIKEVMEEGIRIDVEEGEFTAAAVAFLEALGFPLASHG